MKKSLQKIKKGSCRNRRIGSRKNPHKVPKGVFYVQTSFNNIIVTVTDARGRVISWSSSSTFGFRGTRRGTPFVAQTIVGNVIRTVVDQGVKQAKVMIKGPSLERDTTLRAIRRSGILLNFDRDVTPIPHNGCRTLKKTRVKIEIEEISSERNNSMV